MIESKFVFSGVKLLEELRFDYEQFAEVDEPFESWVHDDISDVEPDALYETDTMLSYWKEIAEK